MSTRRIGMASMAALMMAMPIILFGCDDNDVAATRHEPPARRAEVTGGGAMIVFPQNSPGLLRIRAVQVEKQSATIPVIAPARVVAAIVAGLTSRGKIVLFDSPDVTSLYSQYRQSSANVDRTSKNLSRVREMFENQAATAKDLNEAENEAANSKSAMAESEAKLRGLGYNPFELETVPAGTAWLICDLPESELHEVQKGESVEIELSSFPDRKFRGRADAIGEVIDPLTRTVKVRVSTPNPRGRILPGMFARVNFGDAISGVVLLPAAGVVTVEGADYAFIQKSDTAYERRRITLASSGARDVVVVKGLADGERVVTEGTMLLKGLSFGY